MERMENSINPLRGLIECQRRPVNEVQHNISRVIIESRIGENGGRGLQMIGSPNYRTWSTRLVASRTSLSLSVSLSVCTNHFHPVPARMPSLNTLMDGLLKEIQCATCAEIPG